MIRFAPKYVRTVCVLALMLFAVSVHTAEATHFLGGKITWVRDLSHPNVTEAKIIVTFQANWRWTYPWTPANPAVGTIPGTQFQLNVIPTVGTASTINLAQQVLAINAAEDWFVGEYTFTLIYPLSAFPLTLQHASSNRSSDLLEGNADTPWQLRTVVDISKGSASPNSTLLPRVYLTQDQLNEFTIPNTPHNGLTNKITIAPITDSLLFSARPVGMAACAPLPGPANAPCALCENLAANPICGFALTVSNDGLVSWTPHVAGLYAVQFKITSVNALGQEMNSMPLDALLSVAPPCDPEAPGCNTPPTISAPATVTATAGQLLSVTVSGSDLQADQTVTVIPSVLPPGATFNLVSPPPLSNNVNYQLNWTPTGAQLGSHSVCFQAADNQGAISIGQKCIVITVQPSPPPALVCNAVGPLQADRNGVIGLALSGATFDPEGTAVSVLMKIGALTIGTATIPAGTSSLAPFGTTRNFSQGTTTVTVTATDAVGSSSSCNIVVTVNKLPQGITFASVDPVPFVFESLFPLGGIASSGLQVQYQVVSGPGSIVGDQLKIQAVGSIEVSATQPGDLDYAPAEPKNAFFHVRDVTGPVIAAHGPVSGEATGPAGAILTYTAPGFTDDVDPAGTATCTPASSSTFPVGSTTVTCSAEDAAGNDAIETTFTVTVNDTTAPTIGTNGPITTNATGPTGATVTFAPPAASDTVDGAITPVCVPGSGSAFGLGTTQVTCTATDAHHNSASSIFDVTITNNAPTVSVPGDITAEATSSAGAVVLFSATANDIEQGPLTPTCSPAAGPFPIGTTPVLCTASDVANATGSAGFTVTVRDTTAPVVTYSGNAGTYSIGQTINITCLATDAVGVTSTNCANVTGPAYLFAASNTYSATAADAAGNIGNGSTTFTVVTTIEGLQGLVNAFCNNPGVCQGLNAKLTAAANAPNVNARNGQLGAFENQLAAQVGKCMTAQQAATLLQLVRAFFN